MLTNTLGMNEGLKPPDWRDDRTKRVSLSLLVGGLMAGVPLVLSPVAAASDLPHWRELSGLLMVPSLWPYPLIRVLLVAAPGDSPELGCSPHAGVEGALLAALITSVTVYALATYAILSRRARRVPMELAPASGRRA